MERGSNEFRIFYENLLRVSSIGDNYDGFDLLSLAIIRFTALIAFIKHIILMFIYLVKFTSYYRIPILSSSGAGGYQQLYWAQRTDERAGGGREASFFAVRY